MDNYLYYILKKCEHMPGAFDRWEYYRKALTERILNKSSDRESIIIFGAGECNDLDLKILENEFKKVTLVDKNESSMQKALNRYGLQNSKKIHIKVVDFLNISDEEFIEFEKMLINKSSITDLLNYLENLKEKLNKIRFHSFLENHQTGVCINVHSQLLSLFGALFASYSKFYDDTAFTKLHEKIYNIYDQIVPQINNEMLETITKRFFLGVDLKEFSDDLNTFELLRPFAQLLNSSGLSAVFKEYDNFISGSVNALFDMERIFKNPRYHNNENMFFLNWPFEYARQYLVILETIDID